MRKSFGLGHTFAAAALLVSGAVIAQAPPMAPMGPPAGEILASMPGDRIENVVEAPDGSLYFTAVFGGKVMHRSPDGTVSVFLPLHSPQGVLVTPTGFLVDQQLRDPDFGGGKFSFKGLGARLLVLAKDGKTLRTLSGPDEDAFYNGIALAGANTVFIADTGADRILQADPKAGTVAVWYTVPHDGPPTSPFGANGLKVHAGWVYFAHVDVYRVKIGGDGKPEGGMVLAAKTGGTDDFDVAADGTVYASHGSDVIKATPGGETSVFIGGGCPMCTATRVSRDGKWLYLTGGSIPRPNMPATPGYVSRVPLSK